MAKKTYALIISLVCAAVLCTVAFYTINASKSNIDPGEPELIASDIDGEISNIKYTDKDGFAEELTLSGGEWKLKENESFPLNQSQPTSMASLCKSVIATRYVGESENKSEYGLNSPLLIVTITSNSTDTTYIVGNKNSHTGDYYFNVSGTDGIYTVGYSFVSAFKTSAEEMAIIEQPPVFNASEADSVKIVYNGEEIMLTGKSVTATAESESSVNSEQVKAREYSVQRSGETKIANHDKAVSLLNAVNGITLSECAAFMPESLAAYGLSEPYAEISTHYTKAALQDETFEEQKSYTLLIGASTADGRRYVMLNGTEMVCAADQTAIDSILSAVSQLE